MCSSSPLGRERDHILIASSTYLAVTVFSSDRNLHLPPSHEILESRDKVCSLLAHSTWLSLTPHLGQVLLLEAIVVAGPLRRTPLILTGIQVPFYFG